MPNYVARRRNSSTVGRIASAVTSVVRNLPRAAKVIKLVRETAKHVKSKSKPKFAGVRNEPVIHSPPTGLSLSSTRVLKGSKTKKGIYKSMSEPYINTSISTFGSLSAPSTQQAGSQILLSGSSLQAAYTDMMSTAVTDPFGFAGFRSSIRYMLCSAESIYTFTNCTVGSMELEIYDVVSKQNSFSLILPESSWANGYIGAGQSAPSVQSTTTPWCSPRESVEFNTMWTVKRKLKIELGPGRTHEHRAGATFNMLLDTDKTTLYQSLKGLTHGVLYVHKGQICDDVNTFTIGDIGLSKTKLVCCSRTKVMLRQVPCLPRKSVVSFNNLSTVAAFATNENVVQEGSGIITNIVTSAS